MKGKLRELAERWKGRSSKFTPQGDLAFAYNRCADELLAILDAEEGGYWPDGSDAPIRDYTSAQPTELEDTVREVISLLRSTSIGEANQRIVADKLTAALQYVAPPQASAVPDGWVIPERSHGSEEEWDSMTDYEKGLAHGWNECREAMLAAATQPKVQP